MRLLSLLLLPCFFALPAEAKQFEVFDGQFYNGLYYPLIDMIEWGEQNGELPHMEFHLHSKEKPLEVIAVAGDKGGKQVLWLNILLPHRNERVCRHVLAPLHFRKGMKLYAYRDDRDPDYDNVFVYSEPRPGLSPYTMGEYQRCPDENASNMPEEPLAQSAERQPRSVTPAVPSGEKKRGDGVPVDYDNHAVPFSF